MEQVSVLDLLRAEMDETFPEPNAEGLIVLPAANLGIREMNGKRYVRFKFGSLILTKQAIDKAVRLRKVVADWKPTLKDADGNEVKDAEGNVTILPEVHITLLGKNVVIPTDNDFVGFGERGVMVSAADLY